ncbi:hypothetical protein MAE02_64550 [Microvirga aerophila]|uniref:Uncharacterized protein n=1 Tax=Microvirga aerophila TaxID=670291 RepID=A0A512C3G7_9HYPH|nr:hypothetical protein MAE02_64550 [Microvirga aerophila]
MTGLRKALVAEITQPLAQAINWRSVRFRHEPPLPKNEWRVCRATRSYEWAAGLALLAGGAAERRWIAIDRAAPLIRA